MPIFLLSCGNDIGFEVIDSELWAQTPDNYIHWADEETVLFTGQINDEFLRNRKNYVDIHAWSKENYADVIAWNYKTNQSYIVLDDSNIRCGEGDKIYFSKAVERGIFKGELVKNKADIHIKNIKKIDDNIIPRNLHCQLRARKKSDVALIANLKAFGMELKNVWPEETSLAVKRRGHHPTPIPTIFSDQKPRGLPLNIGKISFQVKYIPYLNKYLLRSGKKSGKGNQGHPYRPLRRYLLLSQNSTLEEISLPDGWDQAQHLFPSIKGTIISYLDMRKENPKSSDNGAFLIVGDKREDAVKLLRGDLNATKMSADGCRLATAHFYKVIPFASNNPTLKIIDMCVK